MTVTYTRPPDPYTTLMDATSERVLACSSPKAYLRRYDQHGLEAQNNARARTSEHVQ